MSSVDSRIVTMKFDNSKFLEGVRSTMSALQKLKDALSFKGANKGMADLNATAASMNLDGATNGVQGLSAKFLALSTIAITALSNITNKAIDAGLRIGKALTIQPMIDGFQEYELKMGSIQTMLANTERYGTTLKDVSRNLDELNEYADKTIYNFGDMTKNIGLFTNAGIKIDDATSMIKGFSNVAAASGTSSQGAAGAAYQLSQALSAGTIRLMDWRSLTNVGMGNKNMQTSIIEIADAMGEFEKAGISADQAQKDFNGSLEKKWLSADVMQNYLNIMAEGDEKANRAAMKKIGLNEKQIDQMIRQQKTAEEAATKVRTFTQFKDTLAEGIGSTWAETFDIIIGDFEEATELWTNVSEGIGDIVGKMGDARNKMLKDWDKLGGRDNLIKGLGNLWKGLGSVIKPIQEAFRDIFPAMTGQRLADITQKFADLTAKFKVGTKTADGLKRTFRGIFAIFSIVGQIVKGVIGVFAKLLGVASKGSGGFLQFTGSIGDFLVYVDETLKKGTGLTRFFNALATVLGLPIKLLGDLGTAVSGANSKLGGLASIAERIKNALSTTSKAIQQFWNVLAKGDFTSGPFSEDSPIIDWLFNIREAFSNFDVDTIISLISAGLLGGILVAIKKFKADVLGEAGFGGIKGALSGALESITSPFDQLTDTLKTMQTQVQAKTLLLIAGAVLMLTASVVALSMIDAAALRKSLAAMAVGFTQLLAGMAILVKISGSAGFIKVPMIAFALILLATSVTILAGAVKKLSTLSWEELSKGLVGVGALLGGIAIAVKPLSAATGGMIRTGIGLVFIGVALKVLASVVKDFAEMEWGDMARGMVGLAGALTIIGIAAAAIPANIVITGAGMILLGIGMKAISSVVKDFAGMSWGEMAKGMVGLAGALTIIGIAMTMIPPTMAITAAGLILVGIGLQGIATFLQSVGGMSWEGIAKGLVAMAGALVILAIGVTAMSAAHAGAIALVAAAIGLALLVPPLVALGTMSWEGIAKGLVTLAGTFVILGLAGYILAPLTPVILGLAIALGIIGAAFILAGLGAMALAKAFQIFAEAGNAGVVTVKALIMLIPDLLMQFAKGVANFIIQLGKSAPQMVGAFAKILTAILDAVIKVTPKIGQAISTLLQTGLKVIRQNFPTFVSTGLTLLLSLLNGIKNNIGRIVDVTSSIIVKFIDGISRNLPSIIQSGVNLIISFVNGLADAIDRNSERMGQAGGRLAAAIIRGMANGIRAGAGEIANAAKEAASGALNKAKEVLGIFSPSREFFKLGKYSDEGMALGLRKYAGVVSDSAGEVGTGAVKSMKKSIKGVGKDIDREFMLKRPVVSPVVDLTDVKKGASKVNGYMKRAEYKLSASHRVAGEVSNIQNEQRERIFRKVEPKTQNITFQQNNHSPKALSTVEIYRKTRSQLSMAREELKH